MLTVVPISGYGNGMQNDALIQHIAASGESYASFGRRIDRTASAVHRYAFGLRIPDGETIERIARASGGAVPEDSWTSMILAKRLALWGENTGSNIIRKGEERLNGKRGDAA